jgi:hypothetical protein
LPTLAGRSDEQVVNALDDPAHRQLLHITYGQILTGPHRARLLGFLAEHEEAHWAGVARHIGRHLAELGITRRPGEAE